MRKLLFILFILCASISHAQTVTPAASTQQDTVYQLVDQMPIYPGGDDSLMKFLHHNIQYPPIDEGDDLAYSREVVSFVVNKDGTISDIKVLKSISRSFDKEIIRVISLMPRFTPGMLAGQPVRVRFLIPLHIHLSQN